MSRVLVTLGHGHCAAALARALMPEGWEVRGATRDADKAARLAAEGVAPVDWPPQDPDAVLAGASHVLLSAAPTAEGDPVHAAMAEALVRAAPRLAWVGYLSTTGVYGDRGGDWVTEDDARDPSTERGRRRVAAEDAWLALHARAGLPVHVFRLAGIYGPGRGPFEKVRAGTARRIVKPGQVFSRIHVEDIVQVLRASIDRPAPGRAWNVCDDDPAPPQDVIAEAARLLGLPPPPEVAFEDAELSPMARSFYAELKRVSNARIKDELGVRLTFPSYRDGLPAVLAAETG